MTKIEWTHRPGTRGESWNPIRARNLDTGGVGHFCQRVSEGCRNCYAERMQPRFRNSIRDIAWIKGVADQCAAAGVPCFVKQLGTLSFSKESGPIETGDAKGGDPSEWPVELPREWPYERIDDV